MDDKLLDACKRGEAEQARLLLGKGASVNATDSNGWSPLHWACRSGHMSTVRLLIESGGNVNAKNKSGTTPLHLASHHGRVEVGCLLLDSGADILAKNENGRTPLQIANRQKTEAALRIHKAMHTSEGNLVSIIQDQDDEQKNEMVLETVAKICVLKEMHEERLEDLTILRIAVGGLQREDQAAEGELVHLKDKVDALKERIAFHEKELTMQDARTAELAKKIKEFEKQDRANETRKWTIQQEDSTLIAAATALKNKVLEYEKREEQLQETAENIEKLLGAIKS
jgi:Ankyrin repeats (3 copies)